MIGFIFSAVSFICGAVISIFPAITSKLVGNPIAEVCFTVVCILNILTFVSDFIKFCVFYLPTDAIPAKNYWVGATLLSGLSIPLYIGLSIENPFSMYAKLTSGVIVACFGIIGINNIKEEKYNKKMYKQHVLKIATEHKTYEFHVWKMLTSDISVTVRELVDLKEVPEVPYMPKPKKNAEYYKAADFIYNPISKEITFCECGIIPFSEDERNEIRELILQSSLEIEECARKQK